MVVNGRHRPSSSGPLPFRAAFIWSAACAALIPACTPSRQDLGNVYRSALTSNFKTFDPAQCSDMYSNICQSQVYETLFQYRYLARPYDVEPLLADGLPEVSDSGRVYRIRLKRGVRFIDDA